MGDVSSAAGREAGPFDGRTTEEGCGAASAVALGVLRRFCRVGAGWESVYEWRAGCVDFNAGGLALKKSPRSSAARGRRRARECRPSFGSVRRDDLAAGQDPLLPLVLDT